MSILERKLAEEAKVLVSQFNFESRKPRKASQLEEAKQLYKRIFFDKNFKRDKSKNMKMVFNNNIFIKITSCTKCAKTAYNALSNFADWVLD